MKDRSGSFSVIVRRKPAGEIVPDALAGERSGNSF